IDVEDLLDGMAFRWDAPLEERIEVLERAAVLLSQGDGAAVSAVPMLFEVTQAARRELARPTPTVQVPGQSTELRYDLPRGLGLVHALGERAACWLAAALVAGNALAVVRSPGLDAVVSALLEAGAPPEVLRSVDRGRDAVALLLALAE